MYVYADVVLAINMVINLIIFSFTSWLTGVRPLWWRQAAGAVVGALYALAMVFPQPRVLHWFAVKILLSVALMLIVYGKLPLRRFFLVLAVFYLASFVLGGVVMALVLFTASTWPLTGGELTIIKPSLPVLLMGAVLTTLLLAIGWYGLRARLDRVALKYYLTIRYAGQQVTIPALLDTGNTLRTVLGRRPVIIANYRAIKGLLDEKLQAYLAAHQPWEWAVRLDALGDDYWLTRLTVVPYHAVGTKQGLLLGLRTDEIEVWRKNRVPVKKSNAIVALYDDWFSGLDATEALLPLDFVCTANQGDDPVEEAKVCVSNGR